MPMVDRYRWGGCFVSEHPVKFASLLSFFWEAPGPMSVDDPNAVLPALPPPPLAPPPIPMMMETAAPPQRRPESIKENIARLWPTVRFDICMWDDVSLPILRVYMMEGVPNLSVEIRVGLVVAKLWMKRVYDFFCFFFFSPGVGRSFLRRAKPTNCGEAIGHTFWSVQKTSPRF